MNVCTVHLHECLFIHRYKCYGVTLYYVNTCTAGNKQTDMAKGCGTTQNGTYYVTDTSEEWGGGQGANSPHFWEVKSQTGDKYCDIMVKKREKTHFLPKKVRQPYFLTQTYKKNN